MEVVKTICQMCGYSYCGINVYRDGNSIVRIEGMKEHPANRGSICPKGLAAQQLVSDPNRLRVPLRRTGRRGSGQWEEISWEDALNIMVERLGETRERYGSEAIAFHRGQAPGWVTTMNYVARFMNTLGSPNLVTHSHLCWIPRAIAHQATYGGVPEPDFDNTNCILLWGFNPVSCSLPNYGRRVMDARVRGGAKLIVVDPRFSEVAAKADLWLQPYPGTDLALALGMDKVIVKERLYDEAFVQDWTVGFDALREHLTKIDLKKVAGLTGVPVVQIQQAARMFAQNTPAVLREGNGLDQHVNVVQTVRAIILLSVLTGNLNVKGGNVLMPALPSVDVQACSNLPEDWETRSISTHPLYFRQVENSKLHDEELFAALETGKPYQVRCLIIQGGDLVAANSNTERTKRLLNRLDFIAVHDLYLTASAQIADLVLPAASFLERDLLLRYHYLPSARVNMVALQQQVLPPIGESRSDLDFLFALAHGLGMTKAFPWENVEEAFNWELSPLDITVDDLRARPEGYMRTYTPSELYRTHGREGFPTESKKAEFYSTRLEKFGYNPLPKIVSLPESLQPSKDYPLLCGTSLKLGIHTHTQFRTLPWISKIEPDPFLEIHPKQARGLGILNGDKVRVESPWGRVSAIARISEGLDQQVVMLAYGYGQPYTKGGWRSSNDLTPYELSDPISGATSNRRVPCRVVREEEWYQKLYRQTLGLLVDPDQCVGCHTCEVACEQEHGEKRIHLHVLGPVKGEDGKMRMEMLPLALETCDLCKTRLSREDEPACVAACPTGALSISSEQDMPRQVHEGSLQICAIRTIETEIQDIGGK